MGKGGVGTCSRPCSHTTRERQGKRMQRGGWKSLTIGIVNESPVDVELHLILVAVAGQSLPRIGRASLVGGRARFDTVSGSCAGGRSQ